MSIIESVDSISRDGLASSPGYTHFSMLHAEMSKNLQVFNQVFYEKYKFFYEDTIFFGGIDTCL